MRPCGAAQKTENSVEFQQVGVQAPCRSSGKAATAAACTKTGRTFRHHKVLCQNAPQYIAHQVIRNAQIDQTGRSPLGIAGVQRRQYRPGRPDQFSTRNDPLKLGMTGSSVSPMSASEAACDLRLAH